MIDIDNELQFALAKKSESQSIQWQWLPLLFLYSAIWFYGLWCLAEKIF
jgi:hypothetical protein